MFSIETRKKWCWHKWDRFNTVSSNQVYLSGYGGCILVKNVGSTYSVFFHLPELLV